MADPTNVLEFDPRLNAPEVQGAPPTPLQGFTGSLGLVPSFQEAGAKRIEGLRASAARGRGEVEELKTAATEQEKAAKEARPDPLELKPPPSLETRPFLMPGKGFLAELQTAIAGATQMVLGVGGLKGRGYAIGAVAGLKGALEGWQAGDQQRANAALKEWRAASEALLENHRSRREFYQDLLTDQQRSMDTRLREIGIQARIDGQEDLARAAEQGQIGDLINILGQRETANQQFEIRMKTLENSIAQHRETAARQDRFHTDLERQRGIVNKRIAELAAPVVKWQTQLLNNQQIVEDLGKMETMVARLNRAGLLQRTPATWESIRATVAQKIADDPELKEAMDWMERLGTARVAAAEIAAGEPASAMRLKAVTEPQVGHILSAGPDFWRSFFARTRRGIDRQNTMIRKNLQAVNPAALSRAEPPTEGWTAEPVE